MSSQSSRSRAASGTLSVPSELSQSSLARGTGSVEGGDRNPRRTQFVPPEDHPDLIIYLPPGFKAYLLANDSEYLRLTRYFSRCFLRFGRKRNYFEYHVETLEVWGRRCLRADLFVHRIMREFYFANGTHPPPGFPNPLPGPPLPFPPGVVAHPAPPAVQPRLPIVSALQRSPPNMGPADFRARRS